MVPVLPAAMGRSIRGSRYAAWVPSAAWRRSGALTVGGIYEASSVLGINLGIDTASSFPCYNI
jgi:hypothetical protein